MRTGEIVTLALGIAGGLLGWTGRALGQPPNDECAGAIPVFDGLNAPGTNVGSTTSAPAWPCASGENDLWYSYVASCTGSVVFTFCPPGSASYDSALAVYSGTCGALSLLGCNDDRCGTSSEVIASVTAGTTYYVRVGGWTGQTGTFALDVSCHVVPSNDQCAGAIPLADGSNGPFSNVAATPSGISSGCPPPQNDVWFTYGAACSGATYVSTCGPGGANFPTSIEVLSGTCGSLSLVACGLNPYFQAQSSVVRFTATAGTTYLIRVGATFSGPAMGEFLLNVFPECAVAGVPSNDECAGAISLSEGLNCPGTTIGASTSAPPWACAPTTGNDVWYTFVATCTGSVTFRTCPDGPSLPTTFPARVEAFEGTCGNLTLIACDDSFGICGGIGIPTIAGRTYFLRVGGLGGATGSFLPLLLSGIFTGGICLPPGPACVLFEENFEGGTLGSYLETDLSGAPAATLWHPESNCSPSIPIPPQMNTEAAAYNQGNVGNYSYATGPAANAGAIESPLHSGTAGASLQLQFDYSLGVEPAGFEQTLLQVRPAGGSWTTQFNLSLINLPGTVSCLPEDMRHVSLTLPSLLTSGPWQHRFVFDTVNGSQNGFLGWYVDNVRVVQSASNGGGSFSSVPTGCGGASLAPSGIPVIGGTVTYSISGGLGTPLLWIWIGPGTAIPLCPPAGCTLGAPIGLLLAVPSLTLPVPCDTSIIGGSVQTQGADVGAPGGCPAGTPVPIQLTVTDTVTTVIG